MTHFYQSRTKLPPSLVQCAICPQRYDCVRASSLSVVDTESPLRLRAFVRRQLWGMQPSPRDTEMMSEGSVIHRYIETKRGVVKDLSNIVTSLNNKQNIAFTLTLCSVRYGLRGTPDVIYSDFSKPNLCRLILVEDKSHISKSYTKQLWAYGLILSDPNCLYTTAYSSEESEDRSVERRRFYEDFKFDGSVEIFTSFSIYTKSSDGSITFEQLEPRLFSRGFSVVNKGFYIAPIKAKQKLLMFLYKPQLLERESQMKFRADNGQLYLPKRGAR